MKLLYLIGCVFLSLGAFSQDFAIENTEHMKVLYRGYENKLTLGQIGCADPDVEIVPINCTLTKLDDSENTYVVKVNSSAREVKINFVSNGAILHSAVFAVKNLPVPSLFWGNNESGSNFSDSNELSVKYNSSVPFVQDFEVLRWSCLHGDDAFGGKGNLLSSAFMDYMKSVKTGDSIKIEITFQSSDGIVRSFSGSWIK